MSGSWSHSQPLAQLFPAPDSACTYVSGRNNPPRGPLRSCSEMSETPARSQIVNTHSIANTSLEVDLDAPGHIFCGSFRLDPGEIHSSLFNFIRISMKCGDQQSLRVEAGGGRNPCTAGERSVTERSKVELQVPNPILI